MHFCGQPAAVPSFVAAAMTVAPFAFVAGSSPVATLVPGLGGMVWSTVFALDDRHMSFTLQKEGTLKCLVWCKAELYLICYGEM